MNKRIGFLLGTFVYAAFMFAGNARELRLTSPGGIQEISFYQKQTAPAVNGLFLSGFFQGTIRYRRIACRVGTG